MAASTLPVSLLSERAALGCHDILAIDELTICMTSKTHANVFTLPPFSERCGTGYDQDMNPLISTPFDVSAGLTALSVNLNKVALLRNTRKLNVPSVVQMARIALEAGAQGITVHPRPDERHIRAQDVLELAALIKAWPQAEFNIEGNPLHQLMPLIEAVRPHQCTFVPDSAQQATSDHGWSLAQDAEVLRPLVAQARAWGVRVSLFMDPEPAAMLAVQALGADRVELYTESYAHAFGGADQAEVLARFTATAAAAQHVGLGVNAGHDLNRENLTAFLGAVPGVCEVSIGHALMADALELGLTAAVRAYLAAIRLACCGVEGSAADGLAMNDKNE
jgi:pyridoxine 5-phosphate synthase